MADVRNLIWILALVFGGSRTTASMSAPQESLEPHQTLRISSTTEQVTGLSNQTSNQEPKINQFSSYASHKILMSSADLTSSLAPSQLSYDEIKQQDVRPSESAPKIRNKRATDSCSDRLCYGLPMGCLGGTSTVRPNNQLVSSISDQSGSLCSVLVTSKRMIDPYKVTSRDIMFELIALPASGQSNYAAVGFSETGRMQGFVSECLQYTDRNTHLQVIKLRHSYNIPGAYHNTPVNVLSGIKNLGVSYENGYYQCRWQVETAVEFSYEAPNGTQIIQREDLGYKNYHILLASGRYDEKEDLKDIHSERTSSMSPVSLAQTGHIKSLGAHILIRIHGSLMIAIWVGLVTISIVVARYYKNEWANSKINDVAIWFATHRAFMLIAWFGSVIAVIFAYMYTESYHPGVHQISGSTCIILATIQVLGGLFRPPLESTRRVFFNWAHFMCGNLSYLLAMLCLVTASFLAPAHLPPLYIWIIVAFVGTYVLIHFMMTVHQYVVHRSSSFVADSYPKEINSPFRQIMLGILVTITVIYIIVLISLVNLK